MPIPDTTESSPPRPKTALLIDDDPTALRVITLLFEHQGWSVVTASDPRAGIEMYGQVQPDVVILDVDMPDLPGIQVLRVLKERDPDATVIMLSGHGEVDLAVESMRLGAESYLVKPLEPRHFSATVEKALEISRLRRRNRMFAARQVRDAAPESLGTSPAMLEVARQVDIYARGAAPILLSGETGSGKGWIAGLIHARSSRAGAPFVSINCAGLNPTFLDSELFGHEKGAFTDAKAQKSGLFEVADGGTLLLDEIGDLTPELQPKLLTVLETQRFRRLGGTREIGVDVRLVAATHIDLAAAMRAGRFREDLFYRVSALPIHVPSLRERGRDGIVDLTLKLVRSLRAQLGRGPSIVEPSAMELIARNPWPGNVRELRNALERAMLVASEEPQIRIEHLSEQYRDHVVLPDEQPSDLSLRAAERHHIERVLRRTGGNRAQAAKLLGISRQTLYSRLQEFGVPGTPPPG